MSKTIDEKVVEMKFDNKNFETNVQTTLSTLDKLKAKLNLTGASKGLENVSKAANNVNMNGLKTGLETINSKFSAMEVIGVTTLANITNSAVNAGKRLVKSISGVQAAMSGFNEYSMTMNTVQTLVNSTGKSVKEVEKHLKELDDYADKTVYSTADMFNNIYKFTNAGIDLETAKTAMIGIANATAYAGQGAQQASIAYYNLAQSMSMGYLTTIDYKSLNLANIATKEFKQRMADAAVAAGTLKKTNDNLYSTGKKSYTLQALFTEGLKDQWATTNVMMDVFKQYGSQETEIGKKAWAAAQEVKTFGMMMESLQAQAGTAWKDTWQILFGSLDDAKRIWTGLSNFIGNIINKISTWRNTILDIAMNNPLKNLLDKINNSKVLKSFQEVSDKVKKTSKTLEEYQKMITKIWRGDFKNQPYRKALVEQQGFNYEATQSLVNLTDKIAGYGQGWKAVGKITEKDVLAAEKKYGIKVEETTESIKKQQKVVQELTDKQLKKAGLNKDEIYMYRQLEKGAKKYGLTIDELAKKMDKASGRDLLYGSKNGKIVGVFQNIGMTITNVFKAIKKGWTDTFEGITGVDLYMLIEKLNKFTEAIRKTTENKEEMQKLTDTFKGLFSILHIITSVIGGGFKIALQVLKGILGAFNIDILDFTSMIGRAISSFDKWLTENNLIVEAVKTITTWIINATLAVKDWITHNEQIMSVINKIKELFKGAGDGLKSWFKGLKETDNIAQYLFGGLINGIKQYGPKVFDAMVSFGNMIINAIKQVLGIHSPSTVFFEIGQNIIQGLINGLKSLWSILGSVMHNLGEDIKKIDFGKILAGGTAVALVLFFKKITDVVKNFSMTAVGLGDMFSGIGSMFTSLSTAILDFGKSAKAFTTGMKRQGTAALIKSVALVIGAIVASIWVLGNMESDKLEQGAKAMTGVGVALLILMVAMALLSKSLSRLNGLDIGKMSILLISITFALGRLVKVIKSMSELNADQLVNGIIGLGIAVGAMYVLLQAIAFLNQFMSSDKLVSAGKLITLMSISLWLMAKAVQEAGKINVENDVGKAIGLAVGFGIFALAMIAISKFSGSNAAKAGAMILTISFALLIMVGVIKLAGLLKQEEIERAIGVMKMFGIFIGALIAVSILAGKHAWKAGIMILGIAFALGIMVGVIKLIGLLSEDEIKRGGKVIGAFGVLVSILIAVSALAGKNAMKAGVMILMIAGAIALLTGVIFILSKMDPQGLARGLTAVLALETLFAVLIAVSYLAKDNMKTILALVGAVAVLSAICIGLSFIEPNRLLPAIGGMSALMLSFAAVLAATSKINLSGKTIGQLALLVGVIGLLAGIVYLLSLIPNPQNAVKGAIGVSIMMLALVGVTTILSKLKIDKIPWKSIGMLAVLGVVMAGLAMILIAMGNTQNAIKNALALSILLGVMTGVLALVSVIGQFLSAGILAGVLGLVGIAATLGIVALTLCAMDNLKNAEKNAIALSLLLGAMTVALAIASLVGNMVVGVIVGVAGLLVLTGMLFALVGALALMQNIQNAIPNALALSILLNAMSIALARLAIVGPLALIADVALAGLLAVILAFGVVATAIGALMTKFPQLEQFLDKGLPILEKIAEGIGKALGALIANFMGKIADELPHIGKKLSEFMIYAMPFITIAQTVNDKVLNGVDVLAKSILALTGANLVDAVATWISGGQSFSRLGTELSNFAISAQPFINMIQKVKPEALAGAKNLADAVLAFTASNFLESLSSSVFGEKDFGDYGEKLGVLASGLSSFVANLKGFDKKNLDTIEVACEGIKKLTEASKDMPAEGGVWQKLVGEVDIETFGNKLPTLAKGLVDFVNTLTNGGFDNKKTEVVKTACDMIKQFVEIANNIPAEGGIWQKLAGEKDLGKFAENFPKVGEGIAGFVGKLSDGGFSSDKIDIVNAAVKIMWAIKDLGGIDLGDTSSKLEELGSRLVSFANKLTEFVKSLSTVSVEDLTTSEGKLDKIIEISNKLGSVSSEPIEKFSSALNSFAVESLRNFVNGLNNTNLHNESINAIKNLMESLIKVIEDNKEPIKIKSSELLTKAIEGLKDTTGSAYDAGKMFADGFARGITYNTSSTSSAGRALGNKAYDAAKAAIDAHSPSKKAFKLGNFFGQGFVNGLNLFGDKVYKESYGMADEANKGLSKAIAGVSKLISDGIDDDITIRPILDLSNVESGVAAMNGMFANPSVGVMSNLNAISSGMRSNHQNGGENVVDAIDRLGKNISRSKGDTYNVNGITYGDDSDVSNAIQTLISAARIERRK